MSEFNVEVVRVGPITKHPDADTLSITQVYGGYPVIIRTGEYAEGDLAVYVPIDSLVPGDDPRWTFLGTHTRIKAKRLRGVFSMGLLTKAPDGVTEGQDVRELLRIEKWSPEAPEEGSADEHDPGLMPVYTDIAGLRRWKNVVLEPGEPVLISEKLHGESTRAIHDGERLWVGSRTRVKRRDPLGSKWWQAAIAAELDEKLARVPGIAIYGECHGYTGGFAYGTGVRPSLRVFDALDTKTREYLGVEAFLDLVHMLDLPIAPVLHRGPWSPELVRLAEGRSPLDETHVREGFVVRPEVERRHDRLGRVILKMHGEGFLTRKERGEK